MTATVAGVWQALETVMDPELDEPITDLDFVESHTVSDDGVATVVLRLPTFFCAPNFPMQRVRFTTATLIAQNASNISAICDR